MSAANSWRKPSSSKHPTGRRSCYDFVVDDIKDIVWNPASSDNLAISAAKKKAITALAKAYMFGASDDMIDDFVRRGLITLL